MGIDAERGCRAAARWLVGVMSVLLLIGGTASAQGLYVPGPWYDQDKYNDYGIGRTSNYWSSLLGPNSVGQYLVIDEWVPALAWSDYLPSDTNRNYRIDPGETWTQYRVHAVETGVPGEYELVYWHDIDGDDAFTSADPTFSSLPWDTNGNFYRDDGEDWSVWRAANDNSCWAAAASNIMSYVDGDTGRYHPSMYENGVDYWDTQGDDLHFWTDGGQPDEMLEDWGFDDSSITANYWGNRDWWSDSPFPYIRSHLELGIPVTFSVSWADDAGAHEFTVYGMDETTHTLLIADSDSDRGNTEFYEISYRYENDWFQIDWDNLGLWPEDMVYKVTSLGHKTTGVFGGPERSWFEDAWVNGMPGSTSVAVIGSLDPEVPAHVRLTPFGTGLNEQTEARAGRLIINDGSGLTAEAGTTLSLGSLHVKHGAHMTIDGSSVDISSNAVCDGQFNMAGGYGDINFFYVGTQTPGLVVQSGGILQVGTLSLGWDPLVQGGLNVTQGNFTSTPEGEYRLTNGSLTTVSERIGYDGVGVFRQTGGVHLYGDSMTLGCKAGSQGSYLLSAGLLQTGPGGAETIIGDGGSGTLSISQFGQFQAQGNLIVGKQASSTNNYIDLSGYGKLTVAGDEYLGYNGSVDVTQNTNSMGLHSVTGTLRMGYGSGSNADYLLQAGKLDVANEILGVRGTAQFAQQGGLHEAGQLVMAEEAGSNATYLMVGGVLDVTGGAMIGMGGTATVLQGNDAEVAIQYALSLGGQSGSQGNYTLGGAATLETAATTVGLAGNGEFSQTGGSHNAGIRLLLGDEPTGDGTYTLDGGSLWAARAVIGRDGTGLVDQSAGLAEFGLGLKLGEHAGSTGNYRLSGGTLRTSGVVVGDLGHAGFTLIVGTLDVTEGVVDVALAEGSAVRFLRVSGGTLIADTLDLHTRGRLYTEGQGTLRLNQAFLNDAAGVALDDVSVQALQIGHNGRDDDTTFTLGINQNLQAEDVMVGYNLAHHFTEVQMSQGAKITAGHMYLGYGQDTIGRITLDKLQTGLIADYLYVGYNSEGDVAQSKGVTSVAESLYVGFMPGSVGRYTLSGGMVVAGDEAVGVLGEGTVSHWGGTNKVAGSLFIGYGPSGDGRYILDGGTLEAGEILVGRNGGKGYLSIGPTSILDADRIVVSANGRIAGSRDWAMSSVLEVVGGNLIMDTDCDLNLVGDSTTVLSGGNIVADDVHLGDDGTMLMTAKLQQSGGALYANRELIIGPNGSNLGLYTMTGGEMTTGHFAIGNRAPGRMEQSGGTVEASQQVSLGVYSRGDGVYNLSGGSLRTPSIEFGGDGKGVFNWTGGDLFTEMVRLRAQCEMNVDVDWVFSGQIRAIGGTLAMGDNTLTLVNAAEDFDNPTRLSVGVGQATVGELSVLALSEYVQSGQGKATIDRLTINSGTVSIQGGTLTSDRVVVAMGSPLPYVYHGGLYDQTGGTVNAGEFIVSYLQNTQGQANLSGTGQLNTNATRIGIQSYGQFYQTGGSHVVQGDLSVGESWAVEDQNRYTLDDGDLLTQRTCVGTTGWGDFRQGGGVHQIATSLDLGPQGVDLGHQAFGNYELKDGLLAAPTINIEGHVGTHSRGNLFLSGGELQTQSIRVGQGGGLVANNDWTFTDIAVDLSDGGYLDHGYQVTMLNSAVSMRDGEWYGDTVRLESSHGHRTIVSGYGYVEVWGELYNAGRVIADGFGEDRMLDLSQVAAVTRAESNTGHWGWFARNQGALTLPTVTLTGDGVYAFGDDPAMGLPALVNSVQMTVYGLNIANETGCTVTLLSPNDSTLPAADVRFVGVWDFLLPDGSSLQSADLAFRYDNLYAARLGMVEADLRVLHFDGKAWLDVTSGLDTLNHLIYAQGVESFSYYAVGAVPEPATAVVLLGGLALLLARRRTERSR